MHCDAALHEIILGLLAHPAFGRRIESNGQVYCHLWTDAGTPIQETGEYLVDGLCIFTMQHKGHPPVATDFHGPRPLTIPFEFVEILARQVHILGASRYMQTRQD